MQQDTSRVEYVRWGAPGAFGAMLMSSTGAAGVACCYWAPCLARAELEIAQVPDVQLRRSNPWACGCRTCCCSPVMMP